MPQCLCCAAETKILLTLVNNLCAYWYPAVILESTKHLNILIVMRVLHARLLLVLRPPPPLLARLATQEQAAADARRVHQEQERTDDGDCRERRDGKEEHAAAKVGRVAPHDGAELEEEPDHRKAQAD